MAFQYGLSAGALVMDTGGDDGLTATYISTPVYTFWSDQTSTDPAAQYTNFSTDAAGLTPLPTVTGSDGTDGYLPGQLGLFYQQDPVAGMWMSANGGARVWITANDISTALDSLVAQTGDLQDQADGLSDLTALMPVMWPAASDGTWSPRPPVAAGRIVWWVGPTSPPIGGTPEYARNNDQWIQAAVS